MGADQYRPLGRSGLYVPPVLLGTAALGNVCRVITDQAKLAIVGEWFRPVSRPVFVEASYTLGNGAALEVMGRMLRRLEVASDEVIIQLATNGAECECWEKCCRLLGEAYRPKLVLAAAGDFAEWRAVRELRDAGHVAGTGIMVSGRDVAGASQILWYEGLDYVELLGGCTVMRCLPEMLSLLHELASRQIPVILSGVFAGGFLVGGNRAEGRTLNPEEPADRSLLAWRKSFVALCDGHGISPAHACIQFALSLPGVIAVRLDSTYADRVADNIRAAYVKVPESFWASMQEEVLLSGDYPLPG